MQRLLATCLMSSSGGLISVYLCHLYINCESNNCNLLIEVKQPQCPILIPVVEDVFVNYLHDKPYPQPVEQALAYD